MLAIFRLLLFVEEWWSLKDEEWKNSLNFGGLEKYELNNYLSMKSFNSSREYQP